MASFVSFGLFHNQTVKIAVTRSANEVRMSHTNPVFVHFTEFCAANYPGFIGVAETF